jgi:hypothetical protein
MEGQSIRAFKNIKPTMPSQKFEKSSGLNICYGTESAINRLQTISGDFSGKDDSFNFNLKKSPDQSFKFKNFSTIQKNEKRSQKLSQSLFFNRGHTNVSNLFDSSSNYKPSYTPFNV